MNDSSVYKFGLFAVFKLNYGNCALSNGFAVILAKNEKAESYKKPSADSIYYFVF